jgi:hypothetical protein
MVELKNVEMPINSIDSNFLQSIYKFINIKQIRTIFPYSYTYLFIYLFIK